MALSGILFILGFPSSDAMLAKEGAKAHEHEKGSHLGLFFENLHHVITYHRSPTNYYPSWWHGSKKMGPVWGMAKHEGQANREDFREGELWSTRAEDCHYYFFYTGHS